MSAEAFLYAVSVPERVLRSVTALTAGALREVSKVALPVQVRRSALYRATAGVGLRFLIEHVGEVPGIYPKEDPLSRKFVMRYATGTSIELLSFSAFFLSPVWVLAALGDVTRIGAAHFSQIGDALKAEGLLDPDTKFETMTQLLDGLESTSTHLALTVNMPPLDVEGLRREWRQFRANVAKLPADQLPTASDVKRAWTGLRGASREQHQSIFRVSAAMGMSAITSIPEDLLWLSRSAAVATRTAGVLVGGVFLDHYAAASQEMKAKGFASYWARHTRPYLVAAVRNLLPQKQSTTERLLSKLG